MSVNVKDQSLVTNLRTSISNKGRSQLVSEMRAAFFTAIPAKRNILHFVLLNYEDIIELLAERVLS